MDEGLPSIELNRYQFDQNYHQTDTIHFAVIPLPGLAAAAPNKQIKKFIF
jgi:hypothetical protein